MKKIANFLKSKVVLSIIVIIVVIGEFSAIAININHKNDLKKQEEFVKVAADAKAAEAKAAEEAKATEEAKAKAETKAEAKAKAQTETKESGIQMLFKKNNVGYMKITAGTTSYFNEFNSVSSIWDLEIYIKDSQIHINCKNSQTIHIYPTSYYITVKSAKTDEVLFRYVPPQN